MAKYIDPWLGQATIAKQFQPLYTLIEGIEKRILEDRGEWDGAASPGQYFPWLKMPRVGFPMFWQQAEAKLLDRSVSMLSGPLYVSDEYPWPALTSCRAGNKHEIDGFCEPLLQFDLAELSRIANANLGDSIVQVWMDGQDAQTRIIPRTAIKTISASDVPDHVLEFFSQGGPNDRNTYADWKPDSKIAPWLKNGWQFAGFGQPFHQAPDGLENELENAGQLASDFEIDESIIAADALRALRVLQSLEAHEDDWCPNNPAMAAAHVRDYGTAFGAFNAVQDWQFDGEFASMTLVDLSGDDFFNWSDGSAQLLTDFNKLGDEIWFDWSTS